MSALVTMTANYNGFVNGTTYRVRTRNAVDLVAANKATLSPNKKSNTAVVGHRGA